MDEQTTGTTIDITNNNSTTVGEVKPVETTQQTVETKPWVETLEPDLQNYLSHKGWKDPKEVLEGYRNLEKLHGVGPDKILKLPETLEGEEARPLWERLGAPKEANEYSFKLSENVGDENLTNDLKTLAHKYSIPRGKFEGLVNDLNALIDERVTGVNEQINIDRQNEDSTLRKEWAGDFDRNENIANLAAKKLGFSSDEIDAFGRYLGPAKAMKMLFKLGQTMSESEFAGADVSRVEIKTPEMARAEIGNLIKDRDFQRRLSMKDSDAVAKWNRLHQQLAPGEMTI